MFNIQMYHQCGFEEWSSFVNAMVLSSIGISMIFVHLASPDC